MPYGAANEETNEQDRGQSRQQHTAGRDLEGKEPVSPARRRPPVLLDAFEYVGRAIVAVGG